MTTVVRVLYANRKQRGEDLSCDPTSRASSTKRSLLYGTSLLKCEPCCALPVINPRLITVGTPSVETPDHLSIDFCAVDGRPTC
jgi:hypothetical protein